MCYKACFYNGGHRRKKDTHIIIFARAYKEKKEIRKQQTKNKKKTEKKQIRRTTGHRKLGQGKEWTGKQLRKTQYDIHNTHK